MGVGAGHLAAFPPKQLSKLPKSARKEAPQGGTRNVRSPEPSSPHQLPNLSPRIFYPKSFTLRPDTSSSHPPEELQNLLRDHYRGFAFDAVGAEPGFVAAEVELGGSG